MNKKMLVTGSGGLIGSEVCSYFSNAGYKIFGVDNNQRMKFFGKDGDVRWNLKRLRSTLPSYNHFSVDIRNRRKVLEVIKEVKPAVIVHAAAQPSHDRAAAIPFDDFDTNAVGTLNLLEATRRYCKDAVFIFMSTNKVYGDKPNSIRLKELKERWDYDDDLYVEGIPEELSIDQSTHSIFGASKVAADLMVQEYGHYFGIQSCVLRGGCLTGPNHSGVKLHGFLSYLVKCNLQRKEYTVIGYKGKQVRDNIHSIDVAKFIHAFISKPRVAEVYNLGGGKNNSCSILEAFKITEGITGIKQKWHYNDTNRIGDHICYYSDLRKIKSHYPKWDITIKLEEIISDIVNSWKSRK